jgi:hypothetical protein
MTPRAKARADGKKYYRSGKQCRNGHDALRRVDNGRCTQCEHAYEAVYKRRPEVIERKRDKKHVISREQRDELMQQQNNSCAICQLPFGHRRENAPHVDHCHTTGKTRGLLCKNCNFGLGYSRDNPVILQGMIDYLKKHL